MSIRKIQAVKVTKNPSQHDDEKLEHPAFGQISASRCTTMSFGADVDGDGRGMPLYGSDFLHSHIVKIDIHESVQYRGLSRDRQHAGRVVASVILSEAQWATFVSSLNAGSGVPCTIEARDTDYLVPGLPPPRDRLAQFKGEVGATVKDAMKRLSAIADKIEKMGLPQRKTAEIVEAIRGARQEIEANLPFVAKQFGEHVETTVERAKIEVNAYAMATLQRAGVEAIAGGKGPMPIEFAPTKQHVAPCPMVDGDGVECTCGAFDLPED